MKVIPILKSKAPLSRVKDLVVQSRCSRYSFDIKIVFIFQDLATFRDADPCIFYEDIIHTNCQRCQGEKNSEIPANYAK